jgi:hypothetical protein
MSRGGWLSLFFVAIGFGGSLIWNGISGIVHRDLYEGKYGSLHWTGGQAVNRGFLSIAVGLSIIGGLAYFDRKLTNDDE